MASGFEYNCSQFISVLQFPSLNLQVQEVARHFKETASCHDSNPPPLHVSSAASSSHTCKMFLSGLECKEVGAVEASCWGLRRLCETDQLSASDLIVQLLSKLTSCPHALPAVSLMGDLLLTQNTTNKYNLHTNQHPLALAFSSSPHSVLSTIFSLFCSHSAPQALLALWPCLTQILIDPNLTEQRPYVLPTLIEIASVPHIPADVPCSLTRLLLLAAVYESDCLVRTRLMHSLLDLSISHPATLPLSEIASQCYNTLLSTSAPTTVLPLLHKLKRVLFMHPSLLSRGTVCWLCLSLMKTELVQYSAQLADIAELVLETCRDSSVSEITRDSLSLLLFSLLGAQLNLERLRPDISSRYSSILSALLSADKTVKRSVSKLHELSDGEQAFLCVTNGELSLFSSLSSLLLVCPLSLVAGWCHHSLFSPIPDSPPLALCCIVSSLLMELSSPSLPPDQLTESRLIFPLLLRFISRIITTADNLAPPLIALLLLTMDRCNSPEETLITLQTLATLSTHPACVILVLRSLLSLADTPSLRPAAVRALVSLWKQHDAVYPHVKQLIQTQSPSAEWNVARSLSVLDICSERPAVHGEEMLPMVRGLIESREHSLLVSVGLSALTSLASAEAVTVSSSLELLASAVGTQAPAAWDPAVAERATHLLRLCPKLLDQSAAQSQELESRCLQQLMLLLAHSHEQVRAAAVSALSEFSLQELILADPFSVILRGELSIPECLDLSPDRRLRVQSGALFSRILHTDCLSPQSCSALGRLLSHWLEEELTSCSTVFPREHRQAVERGEAALRSSGKVLTDCLTRLKHLPDIPESFLLSPDQSVSILFVSRDLWQQSEAPQKVLLQHLKLLSRSLSYSAGDVAPTTLSDMNTFLLFVNGVKLFMRDALASYRPDPSRHCSPVESLFHLLDSISCKRNPQGAMWLMVGLALNVRELHSSGLQTAIQSLVNSLLSASSHLLGASTDSYSLTDDSGVMVFSQNLTPLSGVAYLALGVLGGIMGAHLKQRFSANTLSLFIRAWYASQQSSPQLDALYALSLSSILRADGSYRLEGGPAAKKLNELGQRCSLLIQEGSYPSQFACVLLIYDVNLIRNKQQELLNTLTAAESADPQLEDSALTCSVLTCRLYAMREISLQECDEAISLFLRLARDQPDTFSHTAVCVILSHTACYGHIASQLLIGKTLSQLRSLLQQSSDANISSLLQAILAVFGTFQPLIGALPAPTPAHYSILQQGVRAFLDLTSPRIDKQNKFSSLMHLLGFVHSRYSHFSDSIRTPSSSQFLPDNTLLTPLCSFLEQSLQNGTISQEHQKFEIIFEELSQLKRPLPTYPWSNLVTCIQRNTDLDAIHSSLLKLIFKMQSRATEQELENITFLFDHWLFDSALDNNKIGLKCRRILAYNLCSIFDLTDHFRLSNLLAFLIQDPSLSVVILEGLVKLMEATETTVIQRIKRDVLASALKAMLTESLRDQICCPEAMPPLVECLSRLPPEDTKRLIPAEGEFFLLLRSFLFNTTREYHWLMPSIAFLISLPPLTLSVSSGPYVHAILSQLSLVRTLPSEVVSEVCLELLALIKPKLTSKSLSSAEEQSMLVFNSLLILSFMNPEVSQMSAVLIQSQLSHPNANDAHSGIGLTLCLSEMTNALISIPSATQQKRQYVPVLKKIYEYLLLFFQLLEDRSYTSDLCTLLFSLLPHLRRVDEVVSIKPWAMMGQVIFIQSNFLLSSLGPTTC